MSTTPPHGFMTLTIRPQGGNVDRVRTLTWETAEQIIRTCEQITTVTDYRSVETIATHDFATNGTLELRILPDFGFGGKVYIDPASPTRPLWCSAYPEDTSAVWFPTAQYEALRTALTGVTVEFSVGVPCVASRRPTTANTPVEYDWHAIAGHHEPEADYIPIGCGQGINLPGPPETRVPTCTTCRLSTEIGVPVVGAVCDLIETIGETLPAATRTKSVAATLGHARSTLMFLMSDGPVMAATRFHPDVPDFDPAHVPFRDLFIRVAAANIDRVAVCLAEFKQVPNRAELTGSITAFRDACSVPAGPKET